MRTTEGAIGVENDDIEPLAREISRLGATLRISVTRLYPDTCPPSEKGPFGWWDIPGVPSADEVRELVRSRLGGGQFEVIIADRDPSNLTQKRRVVLQIGGDMRPFSLEGCRWFSKEYGVMPPVPQSGDGKPSLWYYTIHPRRSR